MIKPDWVEIVKTDDELRAACKRMYKRGARAVEAEQVNLAPVGTREVRGWKEWPYGF